MFSYFHVVFLAKSKANKVSCEQNLVHFHVRKLLGNKAILQIPKMLVLKIVTSFLTPDNSSYGNS